MSQVTVLHKTISKVFLTEKCVSEADAEETVRATGRRMANIMDVLMDRQFINAFKGTSVFIGNEHLPETPGLYCLDRKNIRLRPIEEVGSHSFQMEDKLRILASAVRVSKIKRTLILDLGQEMILRKGRNRIKGYGPIFLARVAQCNIWHGNTGQNISNVLRS